MLDQSLCIKKNPTILSDIAEEVRKTTDASPIETFIATLTPEQKTLWMRVEEAVLAEANLIQDLTVERLHCPQCQACKK